MGINQSLLQTGMAQIGADVTEADAFLQEVRGVAVPQGVDVRPAVHPAPCQGDAQSKLPGNLAFLQFEFLHPANRSLQIETSSDLLNWMLWDVPGNMPSFPASAQTRTFTAPADGSRGFFRPQFRQP